MNHYERLKVTQDAPPEVIRAAYRALANRLHPDRTGGSGGPDDETHEQMVALNAAYEVLIDPVLRADYDATLAPTQAWAASTLAPQEGATGTAANDRIDVSAFTARPLSSRTVWAPEPRFVAAGMVGVFVLVLIGAGLYWRVARSDHPLDDALSAQVAKQDAMPPTPASTLQDPVARATQTAARRPTVDELSRMSDEELVKALPALDGRPAGKSSASAAPARGAASRDAHPLDGTPIRLRVENRLVDPLATEDPARR